MTQNEETTYVTVGQAMEILGTTRPTMARLIRDEELHTISDPLDKRVKLILRSEVEALKARSHFKGIDRSGGVNG